MPVIKSAIKKLRKDRKREKENDTLRAKLERAIRTARKSPAKTNEAYSVIDRAVKRHIIHQNKAARLKYPLSKLVHPERSRGAKPAKTIRKPTAKLRAAKSPKRKVSSSKK